MPNASDPILNKLLAEIKQAPQTRQALIRRLERLLGRRVVTFFTSFRFPILLDDSDTEVIEGVLQKMDLSNGLSVVISSPGGEILAAERIVNACRIYSGGNFEVIVPSKAKSAATMICLGARRILMSETSELGPLDPQVVLPQGDGSFTFISTWSIIESYRELLEQAAACQGRIEPFLQQLERYDARLIKEWERGQALTDDIVVQVLQTGMMPNVPPDEIRQRIDLLLNPNVTKSHGRPIYWQQLQQMGLKVERVDGRSAVWQAVLELHMRSDWYVSNYASKLIETRDQHFEASPPNPPQH
jgi:hypothetical protein